MRDKSYFLRENVSISRDTSFSWNFSPDKVICNTTLVINHDTRAFICRNIEPDMCIRGFSFIFEMNAEGMAASVSILCVNLLFLMPICLEEKCVWS